jgi:hypothetical protein
MVGVAARAEAEKPPATVVSPQGASFAEKLAAHEVRRYVYLRTGELLPIVVPEVRGAAQNPTQGPLIVVGRKDRPEVTAFPADDALKAKLEKLAREQYVLTTIEQDGRPVLLAVGGDDSGTLYAAYRLAEHFGIRFYLHGDVVPDDRVAFAMPQLDERGEPLFDRRGIQPFHDFPEGPDWWNADGYKAVLAQLPKLRMNFFGLHCYPEGGVGPEPLVWIGREHEFRDDGTVTQSYPSRHFHTNNPTGAWGYRPMNTCDYTYGAAALYDVDNYAADYMRTAFPWNDLPASVEAEVFDRMGALLRDAFTFAGRIGVKTCIGTETPLKIPKDVQERLKSGGSDPKDLAVVQRIYEGMFRRIEQTHPLDYYWFWTPENWTWQGANQKQVDATLADIKAAIAAAKKVNAPFTLATCGWVLGPPQDRALFDNVLPKDMPVSCINREVGHAPVEPGFARVEGRPKWAIPWLEDDPAMIIPQLWVGRMRHDAVDAKQYGCTGLMGIHWRTRILGPNVSALARAAWDQGFAAAEQGEPAAARPPEGPQGGRHAHFPGAQVVDTEDDPLYRDVCYDVGAYRLDVPGGRYKVTLRFCEPHYGESGKRSFGVKLQGRPVIDTLDIFGRVGKNKALDYTFDDVEVKDGRLVIEFVYQVEYPCIAAIAVEGEKATRKINCGGPAYKDYAADWPASNEGGRPRHLPAGDFYADWARSQFGSGVDKRIAALFTRIDGKLPRPSTWVHGPGGIKPDKRPWSEVQKEYAFVEELAGLLPAIKGHGNIERFEYWLDNFRYLRAVGRVNCVWAEYNAAVEKVKAEKGPEARRRLARGTALPLRKTLVAAVGDVHRYLLATVSTTGAMGTVTNWQQHLLPELLIKPGEELAGLLGEPLPEDAVPPKRLELKPRLVVPVVRTMLTAGEQLDLDFAVLGAEVRTALATVYPLGSRGSTASADALPADRSDPDRGCYSVRLPIEAAFGGDFEYYLAVTTKDGRTLYFPPGAPERMQTVVVVKP